MIARHHRMSAPAGFVRACRTTPPPPKLSKEALAKLGIAPTIEASSEASKRKLKEAELSFDEFSENDGRLAQGEKPPALGVLGAFVAAGLGMLGFSLWRGYQGKYLWPKVTGKVMREKLRYASDEHGFAG